VTDRGTGARSLLSRRHALGAELVPLDSAERIPRTGVAIVACMDARLAVEAMFGLRPGDAHVIRNAGGCVNDDTLRSLRVSQLRGGTSEIVLVHHEDCAAVSDPATDLAVCARRIRTSRELPHTEAVRAFVYTRGGALREIRPGDRPDDRPDEHPDDRADNRPDEHPDDLPRRSAPTSGVDQ
jgi:carbonic anhydrase